MEISIITGLSGAGKSAALNVFEDMGYYCIDNMPPQLIANFVDLSHSTGGVIEKLAVVVDIRGGQFFENFKQQVEMLKGQDLTVEILFLDCDDDVLIKRYKELRRPHPLDKTGNIFKGIQKERAILAEIHALADRTVNTSKFTLWDFKRVLTQMYGSKSSSDEMIINVVSFGFKHGILLDGDLIFDVRFLPNPYYKDDLKTKTGMDEDVVDFVTGFEAAQVFLDKTLDLLTFLIPYYKRETKFNLVIGIGCTGGQHRSVVLANALASRIEQMGEIVLISHREEKRWPRE